MNGERRLIGCPGGAEAAGLLGHGSGRPQGLLDPALVFLGLVASGPDLLLRADLGRLRPIVSHSGGIRAIMLPGLSRICQRQDRHARFCLPRTVHVASAIMVFHSCGGCARRRICAA